MWLKYQKTYYNLDRVISISFKPQTIVINRGLTSQIVIGIGRHCDEKDLGLIREMFESSLSMGLDIFDLDGIYEKSKRDEKRIRRAASH